MSKIHVGEIRLGEKDWIADNLADYFAENKAFRIFYIDKKSLKFILITTIMMFCESLKSVV